MEREEAKKIIEALLYMTDHALTAKEMIEIMETKSFTEAEVDDIVHDIAVKLDAEGSSIQVLSVAGGVQMATRTQYAPWVRRLYRERLTVRLSPSAMETLSIIAYKQPIARAEVEQIRGVEASGVMDTLVERRLIKVVGRKETIGRPLLYGTTIEFLRHFGLKHLTELPDLASLVPTETAVSTNAAPAESGDTSAAPDASNSEIPTSIDPLNADISMNSSQDASAVSEDVSGNPVADHSNTDSAAEINNTTNETSTDLVSAESKG